MSHAFQPLHPPIVLVADRTLSADYRVLFEGIFGTMQTTKVPKALMRSFVAPPMPVDAQGRAQSAPLGIRRVEAAIVASGAASRQQVVCTTPEALGSLLGPWTRIVGVSSSDFLGRGMSNTTTHSFWGGRLYTEYWLEEMMSQLRRAKDMHKFTVLAGGAGAWQLVGEPDRTLAMGIDCVFEGNFEGEGPSLVKNILAGRPIPSRVQAGSTACEHVRSILGPSMLGVIELSRGCGKGCRFCTSGRHRMSHLSPDLIVEDLAVNVAGGRTAVVSSSEDFFRYGAQGQRINFDAMCELLHAMRTVRGLSFMQIDHANISSVLQMDVGQLRQVRELLTWNRPTEFLWVNLGVESANGELVQSVGPGKAAPFDAANWEDMVKDAAARLEDSGFFPVFSIVLGLPGETPRDVQRTWQLVQYLASRRSAIFPIFYEPVEIDSRRRGEGFGVPRMTLPHLELYTACYELNFRRIPRLYWDNQRAGGVGLFKRLAVQALGRAEVRAWRKNFQKTRQLLKSK